VRLEAYRRSIGRPRPRYESLFEPREPFPEGELDRVRLEPTKARAEGIELLAQGRARAPVRAWWVGYTLARTDDLLVGAWVPRPTDQTHSAALNCSVAVGPNWDLALAWRFHTGWPTGTVGLRDLPPDAPSPTPDEEADEQEPQAEDGPVVFLESYGRERVAPYHRLDLRLSREWLAASGRWRFYLDVQNAYDRRNIAGFDLELDEESGAIVREPEPWAGFFASAGLTWEF
jgi:hypothetical protein